MKRILLFMALILCATIIFISCSKDDDVETVNGSEIYKDNDRVEVVLCDGLVAMKATELNATAIIKGVRDEKDFGYEMKQADCNMFINHIPTVFIPSSPNFSFISSTLIRAIITGVKDKKKIHNMLLGIVNRKFYE